METVGYAALQVIPSFQGLQARMGAGVVAPMAAAGATSGKRFGAGMLGAVRGFAAPMAGIFGVAAIAGFLKSSVQIEAQFSQTMNTLAAVTKVPQAQIEKLSALAMKFGADTEFSANEAASAMLELAKGGLTTAAIRAGALDSTLTLASAGGIALADAAGVVTNGLSMFGLRARDAGQVAAALAGAANASTASIGDMTLGLSQVGPGARNAGLSLQETTAVLAGFANAGIKGSDAGTSLKVFLQRLVPTTSTASTAFKTLGLNLTNARGEFVPLRVMAQQLQDGLKGLSDAQRTQALSAAFGSDASRAALVLAKQGADGIKKLTRATSDQAAADRVAEARMSGTAGALAILSGSWETLQLAVGKAIQPVIQFGALALSAGLNALGPIVLGMGDAFSRLGGFLSAAKAPLLAVAAGVTAAGIALGVYRAYVITVTAVTRVWAAAQALLNGTMAINPVTATVIAIGALVAVAVLAYQRSETFRAVVQKLWAGFKQLAATVSGVVMAALRALWQAFQANILPALVRVWVTVQTQLWPVLQRLGGIIGKVVVFVARMYAAWIKFQVAVAAKVLPVIIKVAGFLTGLLFRALAAVIGVIARVIGVVARVVGAFVNFAAGLGRAAAAVGRFVGEAVAKFAAFARAVAEKVAAVVGFVGGIQAKVLNALRGAAGWLVSVGADMIRGLIEGIKNMAGAVAGAAVDAVKGAVNAAKSFLGIGSPSKLMMVVGADTIRGLAIGIRDKGESVTKAMVDVTKQLTDAAAKGLAPLKDVAGQVLQFAASIRSGLADFGAVTSFTPPEGVPASAGMVLANMRARLTAVRKFGRYLVDLKKLGLNNASLQDVIAAGPVAGSQIAAALLAQGRRAIRQVNTLESAYGRASAQVGQVGARSQFGMTTGQAQAIKQTRVDVRDGAITINVGGDVGPRIRREIRQGVHDALGDVVDRLQAAKG